MDRIRNNMVTSSFHSGRGVPGAEAQLILRRRCRMPSYCLFSRFLGSGSGGQQARNGRYSLGYQSKLLLLAHDRRRILHSNVTRDPTSAWVIQQLREAFLYDSAPGYLIFDRGSNFNQKVIDNVKSFGIQPKRTSFRSL